jgi:hypothetical protein
MGEAFYVAINVDVKSDEWKKLLKEAEGCDLNKEQAMLTFQHLTDDISTNPMMYEYARDYLLITSALFTINKSRSRNVNNQFEETLLFYHNVFESYR